MSELAYFLDRLYLKYHRKDYLYSDPLEFVHRYRDPWDQEVVAILSALLAYGNVKQIKKSVAEALNRMEKHSGSPSSFVRTLNAFEGEGEGSKNGESVFRGFTHRFNVGGDLALLLELVARSWTEFGSVGAHFVRHLKPNDEDFSGALNQLIRDWNAWATKRVRGRLSPGFSYFLTAPEKGSVCKRWCMLLRWMGRRDELDPGLWTEKSPLLAPAESKSALKSSQLILPLDTHTGRISQYIGLTRRKSLNWKAALEVTASLRVCDTRDPAKYDFALSRLGILDLCQKKYRAEICERCELLTVCRFAARSRKKMLRAKSDSAR